jgi:drug/metabolite transporter (DMT)-like permease
MSHRYKVVLAFVLVYIFWGSTYLGIQEAVGKAGEAGVPPMLMAATRFTIAGVLMLAFLALRGRNIIMTRRDFVQQGIIGVLLLSIANVVLAWAEQWVPTGLAALLVSITPLWFFVLETWVLPGEHRFSGRTLAGLMLGIVGIVILIWPELRQTGGIAGKELFASLMLPLGSLCWALGSVFSKRWKTTADPFVACGWQMAIAGIVDLVVAFAVGDQHHAVYSLQRWAAIIYLVIFGSWVGFTAYIWLLKHVPTPKVTTYAYVNPVVAVFLGWLILNETITGYILAGTVIVVASVALVTGAQNVKRQPAGDACDHDLPECEPASD